MTTEQATNTDTAVDTEAVAVVEQEKTDRLQSKMAAAFDDGDTPKAAPAEPKEVAPVESSPADTSVAAVSPAGEPKLDELTKDIPPHLWRAAMWQRQYNGLTPVELAQFWQKDPVEAERHFHGYHEAMNRANAQMAEVGRQHRNEQIKSPPQKVPDLQMYDPEAVAEKFDWTTEQAQEFLAPIQAVIQRLEMLDVNAQAQMQDMQKRQMESTFKTIEGFFQAPSMNPFRDLYGDKLSLDNPNIVGVLEKADQLRAGAAAQGRQITELEALQAAHDLVTAPIVQDRVRQQIRNELKTRERGATFKPSHKSGHAVASSDAKQQRLAEGIQKVFG